MLKTLSRYWWLMILRGIFAVLFGVLAFIWPNATVGALVLLFGIYALFDGGLALVSSVADRHANQRWWVLLLEGLVGIAAGIIAFVWTGITALVLLYLIAAWALVTGILEIAAAFTLRQELENEWALGLGGVASIILGLIIFFNPGAGALGLVWLIGAYAIVFGALLIYLGFKLRNVDVVEETAVWQRT